MTLARCVTKADTEALARRRRQSWADAHDEGASYSQIAQVTGYSAAQVHLEVTRARSEAQGRPGPSHE